MFFVYNTFNEKWILWFIERFQKYFCLNDIFNQWFLKLHHLDKNTIEEKTDYIIEEGWEK